MHAIANDNLPLMDTETIREPYLTTEQFRYAKRQLGLSDKELADNLGLSPRNGHTRIRRIANGDPGYECSGPMAAAIIAFLEGYRPAWYRGPDV